MEKRLGTVTARWNAIRASSLAFLLTTFIVLVGTLPVGLGIVAALLSGLGLLFGAWSLLRGERIWARAALSVMGLMFVVSLLIRVVSNGILQSIPQLLLAYVMMLFETETLGLVCKHYPTQVIGQHTLSLTSDQTAFRKSLDHMFRSFPRLALVFGSCYLLAIAAIYLGDLFVPVFPVLSDISLYIVAVSVSLALLLILREEQSKAVI